MYKNVRPTHRGRALAVLAVAQFVVALDVSIVNVALPEIGAALAIDEADLSWVVNAYTLAFGGLLLLGGRLGDLVGRRRLFAGALAAFALASLAGGLAQSGGALLAARAAQGVAAAGLAPTALALLTTTFPTGAARARAFAVFAAVAAGGGAAGVLLGGVLTELVSWRGVLLVNVPICAAGLIALSALPRGDAAPAGRPDVAGALLATAGTTLLVLGVVRSEAHGWGSTTTVATLVGAALALAAFGLIEARVARDPLVRPGLLRHGDVAAANAGIALLAAGQFAAFYFVSLQLQETLAYGPIETGLAFLPLCLGVVAGASAATRSLPARGSRGAAVAGCLAAAVAMAWLGRMDASTGYAEGVLGPMLLGGVGIGAALVALTAAATAGIAPREAGMASGLVTAARQVGGAVGLAALVTVAQGRASDGPAGQLASATADGRALALTLAAACIAVAGALALRLRQAPAAR